MGAIATAFTNAFPNGSNVAKADCRALGSTIETYLDTLPFPFNNNSSTPTAASGALVQLIGANATNSFLEIDCLGAIPSVRLRRADGTGASPTAVVSTDVLGQIDYCGYYTSGGTAYTAGKASILGVATENWTSTANGSKIEFWTTPNTTSTLTKALTIGQDQSVKALGGLGYDTGVGGTATQATSKSTGVTLNALSGTITLNNASLNGNTNVSFTLTNSYLAAADQILWNHQSGGTLGAYNVTAVCGSGSATVTVRNITGGALGEAAVLQFFVLKAVTS